MKMGKEKIRKITLKNGKKGHKIASFCIINSKIQIKSKQIPLCGKTLNARTKML